MTHKLLVLEDEPIVQAHIINNVISNFDDFEVFKAQNYEEGLKICKANNIDIALLDVRIQGSDQTGVDLAQQLRKKGDSSIVFITAYADMQTIQETALIKPDSFIVKPFNDLQIPATIHQILTQRSAKPIFPVGANKESIAPMAAQDRVAFYEHTLDRIALISITDRFGKIIHANPKFCEISGYDLHELLGQDHSILNSSHHPKMFWQNCWQTLYRGEIWTGEVCNRAKNGDLYWVKSYNVPYLSDQGEILNFLSIRFDITESQKNKALIRLRDQQADENFNMDFLEHFTGGIIHELTNPATVIKAGLEVFEKHFRNENQPMLAARAMKMLDHCTRQVQYIRNYRERLVVQKQTQQSQIYLHDFLQTLQPDLTARFQIPAENFNLLQPSDLCPNVTFNVSDLEKVIVNVIQNSVDFFDRDASELKIKFIIEHIGESVFLEIGDNGPGISKELRAKAFLPFVSTKPKAYEVGLGLAQVRQLAQANGARVFFDEDCVPGTCIVLEFPLRK